MFKIMLNRAGIAMIELIFAIVIMGIVLMSAPMLISQAAQSGMSAVQQEAIVAGASKVGMILTRHWDEQDTNASLFSPVLGTDESITGLDEDTDADGNLTGRRVGTPPLSSRSFLTSVGTRLDASTAFTTEGDTDDIDDFHNDTATLGVPDGTTTTTQVGDYIDDSLNILTTVAYISAPNAYVTETISFNNPFATAAVGTANIKALTTTITSGSHNAELGTNIILRAFSCNIGTYELKERNF